MHSIPSIHEQSNGLDQTKKAIAYAAAGSNYADRYNNGEAFYYVEIRWQDADKLECTSPIFGADTLALESYRFETLYHAERFVEGLTFFNWCPQYLSSPLPGSKFTPTSQTKPEKVILIMEDWHQEQAGFFRAYEATSVSAPTMFPLVGYASHGGSYRTIRETVAHASKRVPPGTHIYRSWHSDRGARLITITTQS